MPLAHSAMLATDGGDFLEKTNVTAVKLNATEEKVNAPAEKVNDFFSWEASLST